MPAVAARARTQDGRPARRRNGDTGRTCRVRRPRPAGIAAPGGKYGAGGALLTGDIALQAGLMSPLSPACRVPEPPCEVRFACILALAGNNRRRAEQGQSMNGANRAQTARGGFASEAEMVEKFVYVLGKRSSGFGCVEITREWDHRSGFVDVLARDGKKSLIAFEAKLADWKRAFMQAYRNTAYADRAYVLLPSGPAERALAHRSTFEDKGVGLCRFDGEQIEVLLEAAEHQHLVAWIRQRAHEHFNERRTVNGSGTRRRSAGSMPAAHA